MWRDKPVEEQDSARSKEPRLETRGRRASATCYSRDRLPHRAGRRSFADSVFATEHTCTRLIAAPATTLSCQQNSVSHMSKSSDARPEDATARSPRPFPRIYAVIGVC